MKNNIIERWKPIKGYEALYEVSDLGNVRSLNYNKTGKVKVLSPGIKNGYLCVNLYKKLKAKNFYVHRLVVTAFIGPIPKGLVVNHINEIKTDNRLSNLEIVTQKQNVNHGRGIKRLTKAVSKQLDLLEAEYPFREYTFPSSYAASEFFNYNRKETVGVFIFKARQRGRNWINLRNKKYFFAQQR